MIFLIVDKKKDEEENNKLLLVLRILKMAYLRKYYLNCFQSLQLVILVAELN